MDLLDKILQSYQHLFEKHVTSNEEYPVFTERELTDLCRRTIRKLSENPTPLLEIDSPVMIVGDIHGSIEDLLRIFRLFRPPPETNYLFLGDYVDRGDNSVEVMTIILALYNKYPEHMFLLRGNHEFSHINKVYGFYEEIRYQYERTVLWSVFQRVFSYMPLAAVVNKEVFCVHGGLSPYMEKLTAIKTIKLPIDSYDGQPLISDLLWSDPSDANEEFASNHRGSGVLFGKAAVKKFLSSNDLKFMVRGHQCTTQGVHAFAGTLGMTVFSCSDYCSLLKNRSGALQLLRNGEVRFYSLGDDSEEGTCQKAIMVLVNGRLGLQRSTKSYARQEPVTLDPKATSSPFKIIPLDKNRTAMTLQGIDLPPILPKPKPQAEKLTTKKKKKSIKKKKQAKTMNED